jgi:hypothetical protein
MIMLALGTLGSGARRGRADRILVHVMLYRRVTEGRVPHVVAVALGSARPPDRRRGARIKPWYRLGGSGSCSSVVGGLRP